MSELLRKNIEKNVSITNEEWNVILNKIEFLQIQKNTNFQVQGSINIGDVFVLKGALKSYKINDSGAENVLFFTFEDDWIIDIESLYYNKGASYNIKTIENSELAIINKSNKTLLSNSIPQMKDFYLALLAKSNIFMQNRLLDFLNKTSSERYGEFKEKNPNHLEKINNKNMSSYLGISEEFLSKIKRNRSKGNS